MSGLECIFDFLRLSETGMSEMHVFGVQEIRENFKGCFILFCESVRPESE